MSSTPIAGGPPSAFRGKPGEVWTNKSKKTLFQFQCSFRHSCAVCIQYATMIGSYWPVPLHEGCSCKNLAVKPGCQAAPFVDFMEEIKKLDQKQQCAVMGAENWILVRSGKVQWSDVVTRSRIRPFYEVVERARLSVEQLIALGVSSENAQAAWDAVHTPEKIARDATARAALNRLRQQGYSDEQIKVAVTGKLLGRLGTKTQKDDKNQ